MAKYPLSFTPYKRRDPVTGETQNLMRNANSRQTSERLKSFQRCVAQQMRGRDFTVPGDPQASSRAVREAFSEAAQQCARS
jgi:hypothetical protein